MRCGGSRRPWLFFSFLVASACAARLDVEPGRTRHPDGDSEPDPITRQLLEIREEEAALRRTSDFGRLAFDAEAFGAEPHRVVGLQDGRALGLSRGSARVVLFDRAVLPSASAPGPRLGTGLAASAGTAFAAGELDRRIFRYRVSERLEPLDGFELEPAEYGLDALAAGAPDVLYATAKNDARLFVIQGASGTSPRYSAAGVIGRGPHRLIAAPGHLVVLARLEHSLAVWELDVAGLPTGRAWRQLHDGPFWGAGVASQQDGMLIFATGVEDSPLDRRGGSFGFIDSFLYVYGFTPERGLRLRSAIDTSEYGVVTPRAIDVQSIGDGVAATVFGYGSARALVVESGVDRSEPHVVAVPGLPGTADVARIGSATLAANSLLDAWVVERPGRAPTVLSEPSDDERSCLERVGEALAFTTLIAPRNRSEAELSRFTCETCHFEGGLDGRVHHTGRGAVKVTTRPLRGLFNDAPYFSRALDRDLTEMVHNEFRVAGSGSGTDPWFALDVTEHPWLRELGCSERALSPAQLRRALVLHFTRASHLPNARALPPRAWAPLELAGARVFLERCERCHEARLATHDPASRVPFGGWHDFVFSEASPIVWASERYALTGIEPRVHPLGARVPSLRRIAYEFPYFTNGSAQSLEAVLAGARFDDACFYHHVGDVGAKPGETPGARDACRPRGRLRALAQVERRALGAFLSLL